MKIMKNNRAGKFILPHESTCHKDTDRINSISSEKGTNGMMKRFEK